MKRKISFHDAAIIGTIIFLVLIAVWLLTKQENYDLPPMIMVDGQIYQYQQGSMSVTDEPDGQIKMIIESSEVPHENDMANFGEEGMDYWIQDGGIICVKCNDNYLKFKLQTLLNRSQTVNAVLFAMFNCPNEDLYPYIVVSELEAMGSSLYGQFHRNL